MNVVVDGLTLSYTRHPGRAPAGVTPVVYVHGGTFPSAVAVNWRFADGRSWADDLAEAGHDLWTFDFTGFGASQRYTAMTSAPSPGPLCRSDAAARQLGAVVERVRMETGAQRVALLTHSWGGLIACRYATEHPESVERLVLFAPILKRQMAGLPDAAKLPGWMPMTLEAQLKRFREDVPPGEEELITDAVFESWGTAYLATDPASAGRVPPAVAIPMGPQADIAAAWSGDLPYDPARITCAVSVIRGAWDSLSTDKDAAWFKGALTNCPVFTDAKLERGTHLMLLESGRPRLWAAARNALAENSRAAIDTHAVIFEVQPSKTGYQDYLATAASLRPLLDEVDGFISIERFASTMRPDWILSLSYWADEAAISTWRTRERHHDAQSRGRAGVFQDYRLTVAHVLADNHLAPERQPSHPSAYNDPARRVIRRVAVVEVVGDAPSALARLLRRPPDADGTREVFKSLTASEKEVHLLGFNSEAAAMRWHEMILPAAELARLKGCSCQVQMMDVLRAYGMYDRAQAPQYYPEAGRSGASSA